MRDKKASAGEGGGDGHAPVDERIVDDTWAEHDLVHSDADGLVFLDSRRPPRAAARRERPEGQRRVRVARRWMQRDGETLAAAGNVFFFFFFFFFFVVKK
jgi:hypothetical protein